MSISTHLPPLLDVYVMWPAASSSCHIDFPSTMDAVLWLRISHSSFNSLLPGYFYHCNTKGSWDKWRHLLEDFHAFLLKYIPSKWENKLINPWGIGNVDMAWICRCEDVGKPRMNTTEVYDLGQFYAVESCWVLMRQMVSLIHLHKVKWKLCSWD